MKTTPDDISITYIDASDEKQKANLFDIASELGSEDYLIPKNILNLKEAKEITSIIIHGVEYLIVKSIKNGNN